MWVILVRVVHHHSGSSTWRLFLRQRWTFLRGPTFSKLVTSWSVSFNLNILWIPRPFLSTIIITLRVYKLIIERQNIVTIDREFMGGFGDGPDLLPVPRVVSFILVNRDVDELVFVIPSAISDCVAEIFKCPLNPSFVRSNFGTPYLYNNLGLVLVKASRKLVSLSFP